MGILLLPVTESSAHELWLHGHGEADWPNFLSNWPSFLDHVHRFGALEALGLGFFKVIRKNGQTCGFVTMVDADERFLPVGNHAVELGTYLFEMFRHTGLNAAVKHECFRQVFARKTVDCCLFVVAARNTRAIRALEKLGLRKLSDELVTSKDEDLRPYLRRKSWEQGENCVLFSLWRQQHEQWIGQSRDGFVHS